MDRKTFGYCAAAATASLGALICTGCGGDGVQSPTAHRKEPRPSQPTTVVVSPAKDFLASNFPPVPVRNSDQPPIAVAQVAASAGSTRGDHSASTEPVDPWASSPPVQSDPSQERRGSQESESQELRNPYASANPYESDSQAAGTEEVIPQQDAYSQDHTPQDSGSYAPQQQSERTDGLQDSGEYGSEDETLEPVATDEMLEPTPEEVSDTQIRFAPDGESDISEEHSRDTITLNVGPRGSLAPTRQAKKMAPRQLGGTSELSPVLVRARPNPNAAEPLVDASSKDSALPAHSKPSSVEKPKSIEPELVQAPTGKANRSEPTLAAAPIQPAPRVLLNPTVEVASKPELNVPSKVIAQPRLAAPKTVAESKTVEPKSETKTVAAPKAAEPKLAVVPAPPGVPEQPKAAPLVVAAEPTPAIVPVVSEPTVAKSTPPLTEPVASEAPAPAPADPVATLRLMPEPAPQIAVSAPQVATPPPSKVERVESAVPNPEQVAEAASPVAKRSTTPQVVAQPQPAAAPQPVAEPAAEIVAKPVAIVPELASAPAVRPQSSLVAAAPGPVRPATPQSSPQPSPTQPTAAAWPRAIAVAPVMAASEPVASVSPQPAVPAAPSVVAAQVQSPEQVPAQASLPGPIGTPPTITAEALAPPPQLPLPQIAATRSPSMVATIARADERVRHAIQLAEKGAMYASRKEFTAAIHSIAQAHDVENSTRQYSQATAAGFQALKEASEFSTVGVGEGEVRRLVASHKTPVLKQFDVSDLPPTLAAQYYYNYAKEQLALGVGRETVGSIALYGLAKIIIAGAGANAQQLEYTGPAMALYQAALICEPQNFRAAHELGVLLAGSGQLELAREMLMGSVNSSPQPVMLKNLSVVHSRLGEPQLAAEAQRKAQILQQTAANPNTPSVQWVDPATFANLGSGADSQQPPPVAGHTPVAASPEPAKTPKRVAGRPSSWNPLNLRR